MRLQGRALQAGMAGEDIAALHRELTALGYEIPADERDGKVFGVVTAAAVARFQKAHGFRDTAMVDEATATAMEQVLTSPAAETVVTRGPVPAEPAPAHGRAKVGGDKGSVPAEVYQVGGRVASHVSASVGGLRVVVVDKFVGGEQPVAEAITDSRGSYRISFSGTDIKRRGKEQPDLQARVLSGDRFLTASEVRYNATTRETLDILLDEPTSRTLRSEYETLTAALSVHYQGHLGELQETGERQDVTYLAHKSGWDARAVALAALAEQLGAETVAGDAGIEPPLFYALFRAGVPANPAAIYRTAPKTVEAIWGKALQQGVIPAALRDRVPTAVEQFQRVATRRLLAGPALAGASSLKELLTATLGDNADQHQQVAALYTHRRDDLPRFWEEVREVLGEATTSRLKLDGQLASLTLNNAPLVRKLRAAAPNGLNDLSQLTDLGFYRADRWRQAIGSDPLPPEIPGADDAEKRDRYAELLAAQVRLSFQTAVVAQMVSSGETPVADETARVRVHAFLADHRDRFEVGRQPVAQYVARHQLPVDPEVIREITRIQRVYQITPDDPAMNGLLAAGIDSADAVMRYERDEFVRAFSDTVGHEQRAQLVHAKARQVHAAVLNITYAYLTARGAPGIGVHSDPSNADPSPVPANADDILAYPTLESLFGEMDYCRCRHCRSVLSPAAYLVDLLLFLERPVSERTWRELWWLPQKPSSPQDVLLRRRPDIQHAPLTCENTNTPVPYIDLVNETLEYYVTAGLTLAGYQGNDTDGTMKPEELLASPQFVEPAAYTALEGENFPPPLPFHRGLESLRRYFRRFGAPLPEVMAALRTGDRLERADPAGYGWRDIWMETLELSRAEHRLLTRRWPATGATDVMRTVKQLYGFEPSMADSEVLKVLSKAKTFCRRVGISYQQLADILRTRFVNPYSRLLPKLESWRVTFATLKKIRDGDIDETGLDWLTPEQQVEIRDWVTDEDSYRQTMSLLMLTNPENPEDPEDFCDFDKVELRHTNPDPDQSAIRPFELVRLIRFIRLWKKLGWSIAQTDQVIAALYPAGTEPPDAGDRVELERLDAGFLELLPRLGVVRRVMDLLGLTADRDLLHLLACFADIDTHGESSLYRRMFLSPSRLDGAFVADANGEYLTNDDEKLLRHAGTLRGAFSLSAGEFDEITAALDYDAETELSLEKISAVFRHGWLARTLRLSVRELLLLIRFTGYDPFEQPDPVNPGILHFVELVSRLRALGVKPAHALYLIWNEDLSGKSAPTEAESTALARTLRDALGAIEEELALVDDPDGSIARDRMALVYGNEATDLFFGLLEGTFVSSVEYRHDQSRLEPAIRAAAPGRIAYDDRRGRLSYTGVLDEATRDALQDVDGVTSDFHGAVEDLYDANQAVVGPIFGRYPELPPRYEAYLATPGSDAQKRATLLETVLPALKNRRKRQRALQSVSAAAGTDVGLASALLEGVDEASVLHAVDDPAQPALDDLTVETRGLVARFFHAAEATGDPDLTRPAEADLQYSPGSNPLPANDGAAISGVWSGYLEAPENSSYKFRVDTDEDAAVALTLNGTAVTLALDGRIELRAGTLYEISLTVENVTDKLAVRWWTAERGWEVIPARSLYSATLVDHLRQVYVRFRKAAALAAALKLTAAETAHLGTDADGERWLNQLPVTGGPGGAARPALLAGLTDLLDFSHIKAAVSPADERLLEVLRDPAAATDDAESLLYVLTRWEPDSFTALRDHLRLDIADLARVESLRRVYDAYAWVKKLRVPAASLIEAATNEPTEEVIRDLQAALRASYDESRWLDVLRPINDEMRGLRRDALVAFILHRMRSHPESEHVDTPEKLFEYFLMDVQMDPCMLTSRIRHALSSVQLFIERCLMNLEHDVFPNSINAERWEWMKRYRVWEANRKVFLFPENWLEPELRHDQSPFFKETMSELLQGDITEDRAAQALVGYLTKLDEVAKLEICGVHYEEGTVGLDNEVVHVVARTAGANRKYFYRRRDHGTWTPWERITLDIEDNPVLPFVWNNRLFLFWLRIVQEARSEPPSVPAPDQDLIEAKTADVMPGADEQPKVVVKAILNWSEHLGGQWQPARTSDPANPFVLKEFDPPDGPDPFNRAEWKLSPEPTESGVRIIISTRIGFGRSFLLHNTFSTPEPQDDLWMQLSYRSHDATADPLIVSYHSFPPSSTHHTVLSNSLAVHRAVPPHQSHHSMSGDLWDPPFFYEDTRHVFYVTTEDSPALILGRSDLLFDGRLGTFEIPEPALLLPEVGHDSLVGGQLGRRLSEDANIHNVIGTIETVPFGNREIGPLGGRIEIDGA